MPHPREQLAHARRTLTDWTAPDPAQSALRDGFVQFVDQHSDEPLPHALSRECRAGHLTASTLVVTPDGAEVLLVAHPTVGRWLQLGGHCEPGDATLHDAATREAREECGVDALRLLESPAGLDRHRVRCRLGDTVDELDHLDVQHVATLPRDAVLRPEPGARLRWFAHDALPDDADDAVRALVAAARTRLRGT